MSKLDYLIRELCPDGVEYKTIGELATDIYRGTGVKRTEVTDDGVPCVRYGEIYTKYGIWFDECVSHTREEFLSSPKYFEYGDILFAITGESVEDISKSCAYVGNERCIAGGDIVVLKHQQNPKYLSYALSTSDARMQKSKGKVKSKVVHASIPSIKSIRIPVPPLEVQREIVHILDGFTLLSAELSAELSARKVQYEYYKNKLLDFSESDVPFMSVGELFDIRNGLSKEKAAFGHGKPIINFSDVYNKRYLEKKDVIGLVDVSDDEISRFSAQKGDVFFTRTSETKEDIGMSSTLVDDIKDCVFSGFVLRARPKTNLLLPKFCAYFFSSDEVRKTIVRYAAVTTRATTTGPKLSKIMVPIISIDKQKEIVDILDRFDVLCNDITKGIPAEIEARQKQYEYYRDKILAFKEAI
ncbi:MAG: restriction endonuclease subunit S [Eubacterium sp.]|nr:restriction endonuclease subunit S [Eubacterium sp.]